MKETSTIEIPNPYPVRVFFAAPTSTPPWKRVSPSSLPRRKEAKTKAKRVPPKGRKRKAVADAPNLPKLVADEVEVALKKSTVPPPLPSISLPPRPSYMDDQPSTVSSPCSPPPPEAAEESGGFPSIDNFSLSNPVDPPMDKGEETPPPPPPVPPLPFLPLLRPPSPAIEETPPSSAPVPPIEEPLVPATTVIPAEGEGEGGESQAPPPRPPLNPSLWPDSGKMFLPPVPLTRPSILHGEEPGTSKATASTGILSPETAVTKKSGTTRKGNCRLWPESEDIESAPGEAVEESPGEELTVDREKEKVEALHKSVLNGVSLSVSKNKDEAPRDTRLLKRDSSESPMGGEAKRAKMEMAEAETAKGLPSIPSGSEKESPVPIGVQEKEKEKIPPPPPKGKPCAMVRPFDHNEASRSEEERVPGRTTTNVPLPETAPPPPPPSIAGESPPPPPALLEDPPPADSLANRVPVPSSPPRPSPRPDLVFFFQSPRRVSKKRAKIEPSLSIEENPTPPPSRAPSPPRPSAPPPPSPPPPPCPSPASPPPPSTAPVPPPPSPIPPPPPPSEPLLPIPEWTQTEVLRIIVGPLWKGAQLEAIKEQLEWSAVVEPMKEPNQALRFPGYASIQFCSPLKAEQVITSGKLFAGKYTFMARIPCGLLIRHEVRNRSLTPVEVGLAIDKFYGGSVVGISIARVETMRDGRIVVTFAASIFDRRSAEKIRWKLNKVDGERVRVKWA